MTDPEPIDVEPAPRSTVLCSPWASPADIPETERDRLSNAEWDSLLTMCSEIVWMLSGRRWLGNGCTETALLRSAPPTTGRGSWPYDKTWGHCACWRFGTWANGYLYPAATWERPHYSPAAIRLPREVATITAVTINGEPFAGWRMTRAGWLERTDGGTWTMCDDSTTVEYTFGEPPPEGGVQAVVALAIEFARSWSGGECQLPQRVTSISRQGVEITALDPQTFLQDGRVGLYAVDLWLAAVNPHARAQAGRVWSPDLPVTSI